MSDPGPPIRTVRAVSVGYQGMGNVGDEAILCGIERILAGTGIRIETVVAGPGRVPAAPTARRLPMPRWIPSAALLRALRGSDLLIVAGGGLVNDYWGSLIPRFLLLTGAARVLGCRVAWIGVGVGPLRRAGWRWLARRLVSASHLFAVRDAGSLDVIRRLTLDPRVRQVPDPAWFSVDPDPVVPGDGLAIVLRGPAPGAHQDGEQLFNAIAEVIARRSADGRRVVVVTMEADADRAALNALERRLAPRHIQVEMMALPVDPPAALASLSRFEAVVSVRLHGVVLAALAGRPCLPLIYDPKVAAVATQLGLDAIAIPLTGISAHRIEQGLHAVTAHEIQVAVRERVFAITSRAGEIVAAVEAIL